MYARIQILLGLIAMAMIAGLFPAEASLVRIVLYGMIFLAAGCIYIDAYMVAKNTCDEVKTSWLRDKTGSELAYQVLGSMHYSSILRRVKQEEKKARDTMYLLNQRSSDSS